MNMPYMQHVGYTYPLDPSGKQWNPPFLESPHTLGRLPSTCEIDMGKVDIFEVEQNQTSNMNNTHLLILHGAAFFQPTKLDDFSGIFCWDSYSSTMVRIWDYMDLMRIH